MGGGAGQWQHWSESASSSPSTLAGIQLPVVVRGVVIQEPVTAATMATRQFMASHPSPRMGTTTASQTSTVCLKTVHVNGYTRSDGTYVRGHYRSPPYSNPPSHRSRRR